MSKTTFIYALCEPGTRIVRYIGKSDNPESRLRYGHLSESVRLTTHLGRWLQRVVWSGCEPALVILAEVPKRAWKSEERKHIAAYRRLGADLVNSTDGGEGVTQTPEIRRKIGDSNRGKPRSPEQREQIRRALTGRKLPKSHKKAISNGMTGIRRSLESRQNYRRAKLGDKNPMTGRFGPAHHSFGVKRKGASSKFAGVSWYAHTNRWAVQVSGKRIGYFLLEKSAAKAYDEVVRRIYGPAARTNFPVLCRK